jgi:hypothetical protein
VTPVHGYRADHGRLLHNPTRERLPTIWDQVGQHYAVYRESTLVLLRGPEAQRGPRQLQRFNGEFAALLPWIDRRMRGAPRLAGDVPPRSRR